MEHGADPENMDQEEYMTYLNITHKKPERNLWKLMIMILAFIVVPILVSLQLPIGFAANNDNGLSILKQGIDLSLKIRAGEEKYFNSHDSSYLPVDSSDCEKFRTELGADICKDDIHWSFSVCSNPLVCWPVTDDTNHCPSKGLPIKPGTVHAFLKDGLSAITLSQAGEWCGTGIYAAGEKYDVRKFAPAFSAYMRNNAPDKDEKRHRHVHFKKIKPEKPTISKELDKLFDKKK